MKKSQSCHSFFPVNASTLEIEIPKKNIGTPVEQTITVSSSSNNNNTEPSIILQNTLGKGSYGVTYKGLLNNQTVAIKKLPSTIEDEKIACAREINFLQSSSHPNIIGYFCNQLTSDGYQLIVMEYGTKGTLESIIKSKEEPYFDHAQLKSIGKDIASALSYLHSKNIIHADVKSGNVVWTVNPNGSACAKLIDFGTALTVEEAMKNSEFLGTPLWMAPEILSFGQVSTKSDVYSWGMFFWELFSRRTDPHNTFEDLSEFIDFIVQGGTEKPPVNAPAYAKNLMLWTWRTNPNTRPSAEEVVNVLNNVP